MLEGVGGKLPPLAFDPDRDPVYLTHYPNWRMPSSTPFPWASRSGLARRKPAARSVPVKDRLEGELDPRVPKDYLTQNLIGNFHQLLGMTWETRDWPRARRELDEAARAAPDNDVLFYNLGLIYRRNGLLEESRAAFRRSAEINPGRSRSATKPRASDRVTEVEAEIAERDALVARLSSDPSVSVLGPGTPGVARRSTGCWPRAAARWARGMRLARRANPDP